MQNNTQLEPNEAIWWEGYSAYNGEEEGDNPYPEGSLEFEIWDDGFEDAKEDEAQKLR
ncbi:MULTISPECIES: hypothetical protein [Acinetobacter]|uniref:hypothetical protein n=1 Tax=Acinetobacter TaxID=469 RepID=UPI0027415BC0|nr:hypothetical protein [Acinetobacter baumannii]MDP7849496.1 hypothetical protein [Acinetobacter baumannii]